MRDQAIHREAVKTRSKFSNQKGWRLNTLSDARGRDVAEVEGGEKGNASFGVGIAAAAVIMVTTGDANGQDPQHTRGVSF